jgi:hypothetical protein
MSIRRKPIPGGSVRAVQARNDRHLHAGHATSSSVPAKASHNESLSWRSACHSGFARVQPIFCITMFRSAFAAPTRAGRAPAHSLAAFLRGSEPPYDCP